MDYFIFGDYAYFDCINRIYTFDNSKIIEKLDSIWELSLQFFALGYISYEASFERFEGIEKVDSNIPILDFYFFKKRKKINKILDSRPLSAFYPSVLKPLESSIYNRNFKKIKNELSCGNTYQVNYTEEIHLKTKCDGIDIFSTLLKSQNTPYKAYLKTSFVEIISLSPELFFSLKGNKITLKPMKGTIGRGDTKNSDLQNKLFLKKDPKNRSENLMIVDLLRNDISKIARPFSLKTKLLEIITLPTLHQMISTIESNLDNVSLSSIFEALFPCGSITGAPKKSTMRIIKNLESRSRGVYCGAIGFIHKKNAIFNVAIRTLFKKSNEDFYRYGVGSGVVWDSRADEEFRELKIKTKFLFEGAGEFSLIETMIFKEGKIFLLSGHLKRLLKSAKKLGFCINEIKKFIQKNKMQKSQNSFSDFKNIFSLQNLWENSPFDLPNLDSICMLRLILNKSGDFKIEVHSLIPPSNNKIKISNKIINSNNDLLSYKTSIKDWFEFDSNYFDSIFFNQKGELTQGARSNIVLDFGDSLLTPKLSCGLLNGVLRNFLIENKIIKEAILTKQDLKKASKIFCINSVRGVLETKLCEGI